MNKKYVVTLRDEERQALEALVNRGKVAARKIQRAWILLKAGRRRWTVRLLAKRIVELGYTDRVSPETVRQTLKKTN